MYFETGFKDHNEYILWPKLVIFLFSAHLLQAHAVIQLWHNAWTTTDWNWVNQPTEQNTKSLHTLSLKELVNRECEKIPQLWETITTVIFFWGLGRAATAPPSHGSWALRSSWLSANLLKSLWAQKLTHFLQLYELLMPPNSLWTTEAAMVSILQLFKQVSFTGWSEIDEYK